MKLNKLLALFVMLFASAIIHAQNIRFTEFDLPNGLHVILHEDHSTPIVAVTVMYHVGSKNETVGAQAWHISSNTSCSREAKTSVAANTPAT